MLRVYTVAVTTDALTDHEQSVRNRFVDSQQRLPELTATLVAALLAGAGALAVATVLTLGFVAVADVANSTAGISIAAETVFDGVSATILFGSTTALGIFKFWLGPEISVAGEYGPRAALRMSWIITQLHWWRVVVVIGFTLTTVGPDLVGRFAVMLGGERMLSESVTGLAQSLFYGLSYAVWFAVGTQIYVRYTLRS